MPKISETAAKVPHDVQGFMSVAKAAKSLDISTDTVIRWCKSGKLPSIQKQYGLKVTFQIPIAAIYITLQYTETAQYEAQTSAKTKPHIEYFDSWILAMKKGLMTGRPFSQLTIRDYESFVKSFLAVHQAVSSKTLEKELLKIPTVHYAKRFKLYKGVVCFAKFLIRQGALEESFLSSVRPLFPKRHIPPKRPTVSATELDKLMAVTKTPLERAMVALLVSTGIRVSEAVSLRRDDINFDKKTLTVRLGKGNKTRCLGLSFDVLELLSVFFDSVSSKAVFCDDKGKPLTRMAIYNRLKRMGRNAGVVVTPHTLRRAFVTLNANKGRPLPMLKHACGHSDIRTTMGYCQTTEQDVIDAMKQWTMSRT